MKYIVVLIDGMADEVIESLDNKTPLEYANIKHMDELAQVSELGMVQTVPKNMPPGSDVANLSIMGYDPYQYHTGRSPLEAANIGVNMLPSDVIFRCNLVTVSDHERFEDKLMVDHSASDITSEEARMLLLDLKAELETSEISFHAGTSYRNIIVWHEGHLDLDLKPPHDFLNQTLENHMPTGAAWIEDFTRRSYEILNHHPINEARRAKGLNPANCIWVWGEGKKPLLDNFETLYGLKAATISAVDLIHGIGVCAGMESIHVEGATGTLHTNFKGKANACINALRNNKDFVYLHLEATDECSHQGVLEDKIKAVEIIDKDVVGYLIEQLKHQNMDFRMMILPDHPTPIRLRTHTSDPVPYLIYDSTQAIKGENAYHERVCKNTGNYFASGPELMKYFLKTSK
ncbi:MAG: cofactor-independent phosphoglycerate mutase [Clostridia bacterium]|nr:cofactor-independent phosphoglycerate mutase [Clostridia bacterium]